MNSRVVFATVILVAILVGGNFTSLKFALDHTTPFLLTSMRTVVGGIVLTSFALLRGEALPRRRDDLARILVVSFSITTISSALLVFGVSRVPAGVASLLASTMPLFTAVLSIFLLKTTLPRLAVLGLSIGFIGTIILAMPSLGGQTAGIGIVSMVFSALAWAFGTVYMKWKDLSRVSPIMLVGCQLLMSAVVLVPFALIVEGTSKTDWSLGLALPVAYSAVPGMAVTFALIATVVRRASPTLAASTAYIIPVFGVLFAFVIRGEVLGVAELIGGIFVLIGVNILIRATAPQAPAVPPSGEPPTTRPRSASAART